MKIRRLMNMTALVILITALCFLGVEGDVNELEQESEQELVKPVVLPVTRLSVTIIDGINDKLVKLENCVVQVLGELKIAEDSFNYSNTFVEGDRYEMTIQIRVKK